MIINSRKNKNNGYSGAKVFKNFKLIKDFNIIKSLFQQKTQQEIYI